MTLDLKKLIAKITALLNSHFFTGKSVTVTTMAMGKSFANGYCNYAFPIPYTPESYTYSITSISAVNIGGSQTVANVYSTTATYLYVRAHHSSYTNGTSYLGTMVVTLTVS